MKKLYFYFLFLPLFALLSGCGTTKLIEEQERTHDRVPRFDNNHMVIKYPEDWTDQEKADFRKEYKFKTDSTEIKRCDCGDTDIELLKWDFDNFTIPEIQGAKDNLTAGNGKPQGDEPFTFILYPLTQDSDDYQFTSPDKLAKNYLDIIRPALDFMPATPVDLVLDGPGQNTINIAIIDTGLDLDKLSYLNAFLYPTRNLLESCQDQESGWNFVGNNSNILERNGHGTYVTRIMTKKLNKNNIPFRILPIKVFDNRGTASYWDIVCAFNYIKKINKANQENQNNQKIHIVNASFGYSFSRSGLSQPKMEDYYEHSILREIIEELGSSTIVNASAGNIEDNIDQLDLSNFPASFPSDNIIGVGGYGEEIEVLLPKGNTGVVNLDLAAPFDYEFFDWSNWEGVYVEGSSYSTALATAVLAEIAYTLKNDNPPTPITSTALKIKILNKEPNIWVNYDQGLLLNKIDQGRYIPQ